MNLYVSNVSFHTTVEDLKTMFSEFGEVISAKIILDKLTNRSRGFGFIEMATEQAGRDAIQGLNSKEIEGRALSVSIAKVRESNDRFSGSSNKRW